MIGLGGLSVEALCEKLMWLCSVRHHKDEMMVPVKFFRMVDGRPERVVTVGPSPCVPMDFISTGFDWDESRTFMHTPIPLYASWDDYLAYLDELKEKRDEHDG